MIEFNKSRQGEFPTDVIFGSLHQFCHRIASGTLILVLPLICAQMICSATLPDALDDWKLRHEAASLLPALPNALRDVAFGNGLFVAVGGRGMVLTTPDPDAIAWTIQDTGTAADLAAVTYHEGQFVSVGSGGTILTSTNGTAWVRQLSNATAKLKDVTYANGTFVAVGESGLILTSPDGMTWFRRSSPIQFLSGTGYGIESVVYGNDRFVAVGVEGVVVSSPDGFTWKTEKKPGSYQTLFSLLGVTYDRQTYVAVGIDSAIWTSPDGSNWIVQTNGVPASNASRRIFLNNVTAFNGMFLAVGGSSAAAELTRSAATLLTSVDGRTWIERGAASPVPLLGVGSDGGRVVAVGGLSASGQSTNTVVTSTDSASWRDRARAPWLSGVVFGRDQFVAVGSNGTVLTSTNGAAWQEGPSGVSSHLADLVFNGQTYVAVGSHGTIVSSTDGVEWVERKSGVTLDLTGVTFGNGLFAAVAGEQLPDGFASHAVLTSSNAVDWTARDSGRSFRALYDVGYGGGKFIAVGGTIGPDSELFVTSTNGLNWIEQLYPGPNLTGITFGRDVFVRVGELSYIYTSGSESTSAPSPQSPGPSKACNQVRGVSRNGIARLRRDGNLDASFDPGSGVDGVITALALQNDGKVVIGGQFNSVNAQTRHSVARLNSDGSLDESFFNGTGVEGRGYNLTPKVANLITSFVSSALVLPDNRIVIAGSFNRVHGIPVGRIARLNADGTLDSSFVATPGPDGPVLALERHGADKILVAGDFFAIHGITSRNIGRLNGDGRLDASFDPRPVITTPVYAIRVQTNGDILLAGNFPNPTNLFNGSVVLRLKPDGVRDANFQVRSTSEATGFALALASNGKILVGGNGGTLAQAPANPLAGGIMRLHPTGELDDSFASLPGVSGPPTLSGFACVRAVGLQDDRAVLMAGNFTSVFGEPRTFLCRLYGVTQAPPLLHPAFGNGQFTFSIPTLAGTNYVIEFKNSLSDTNWQTLPVVKGDGGVMQRVDPGNAVGQRFYRLRVE